MRILCAAAVLVLCLAIPSLGGAAGSDLNHTLSAALADFLKDPDAYSDLYERYMGVRPLKIPASDNIGYVMLKDVQMGTSPLGKVLKSGKLRLGYCVNAPYHFKDENGEHVGFEVDLVEDLAGRIQDQYPDYPIEVQWVEKTVTNHTGDEQVDMYNVLVDGLRQDEFDAGFSGLLIIPDQPVKSTIPSMLLFTNIMYTGRGNLDLQALQGVDRATFVKGIARLKGTELTFLSPINGGPSVATSKQLAEDVVKAGGSAKAVQGTMQDVMDAYNNQTVHFMVGDSIAGSYLCTRPGFQGLNLNIPASDNVLQLAPFTLQQ